MNLISSILCLSCLLEALEKTSKLNTLRVRKRRYLPHFWLDNSFKGTVVNRAFSSLHGGLLIFTHTVPLMVFTVIKKLRCYYHYIFATQWHRTLMFKINLSLKYLRFTPPGCKDIGIINFVIKTRTLWIKLLH